MNMLNADVEAKIAEILERFRSSAAHPTHALINVTAIEEALRLIANWTYVDAAEAVLRKANRAPPMDMPLFKNTMDSVETVMDRAWPGRKHLGR